MTDLVSDFEDFDFEDLKDLYNPVLLKFEQDNEDLIKDNGDLIKDNEEIVNNFFQGEGRNGKIC